ncbi:hypothetical protein BDV12DRAFT_201575 [Aspergillus spectabilis]
MDNRPVRLDDLPSELILDVGSYLWMEDLNPLVRTAKIFHTLLSSPLYALGATHVGQQTTPLIWAVKERQNSVIRRLLEMGADPCAIPPADVTTAYHEAVICFNTEALKLLLEKLPCPYIMNKRHRTPLLQAVHHRRVVMLRMILDAAPRAYPDEKGEWAEALRIAVENENVGASRCLLEAVARTGLVVAKLCHQPRFFSPHSSVIVI